MPAFDSGPPATWASLFGQAPLAHYVAHPSKRFRTAFGPVFYRGRLDGSARVLLVGQDPSTDETLAQRILVGAAGQRVQGLLSKLGVDRSYVMLNVFLFGITRQFDSTLRAVSAADPIRSYRNSLFDHVAATNQIEAVVAFGGAADHAVDLWPGASALNRVNLTHPTAPAGVTAQWNTVLTQLAAAIAPDAGLVPDLAPYAADFSPNDSASIPRRDLPFGLPEWHGTGGTHSTRGGSPTKITWTV